MNSQVNKFLSMSRTKKRIVTLIIDSFFILAAFWLSFLIRLDDVSVFSYQDNWFLIASLLPVTLLTFIKLGLYRAVLRYMNVQAVWSVILACVIATFFLVVLAFLIGNSMPRTVPIIFACLCLIFIGGSRLMLRALVGRRFLIDKEAVIIYGAGSAGRQLASALSNSPEYKVVGFIDDDASKQKWTIQGVNVYGLASLEGLITKKKVKRVLLAMARAKRSHRKGIVTRLEPFPVKVQSIPSMAEIVDGSAEIVEFKDVEIEDLLGRDPVVSNDELMAANISNKVVMVTGAGGSIGSELCRQIVQQRPKKLVLFELSEFALYAINQELSHYSKSHNLDVEIIPMLGSIQRKNRVEAILTTYNVQTIYHAAAYKHVPLVEHNVIEGVRNNVFGTLFLAQAAIKAKVDNFVLISTDKAVRPTNVMGTTKRMAELILQALSIEQTSTRFCMVRFGNVLGSSGSVVPLFRKQIRSGGPITLTHPDVTRYFMTIPEAAQLVIQAGSMGKGGDVFILDMGESVKIIDLATKMIHLSGFEVKSELEPEGDIEIKCTGLRPGEKLYEELLIGDNVSETEHKRIMTAQEHILPWPELNTLLNSLDDACHDFDHEAIRELLKCSTDFNPVDGICDLIWQQKELNKALKLNLKPSH